MSFVIPVTEHWLEQETIEWVHYEEWTVYQITTSCSPMKIDYLQVAYYKTVNYKCFYLTTHSTHFIYGYMASDTW